MENGEGRTREREGSNKKKRDVLLGNGGELTRACHVWIFLTGVDFFFLVHYLSICLSYMEIVSLALVSGSLGCRCGLPHPLCSMGVCSWLPLDGIRPGLGSNARGAD